MRLEGINIFRPNHNKVFDLILPSYLSLSKFSFTNASYCEELIAAFS